MCARDVGASHAKGNPKGEISQLLPYTPSQLTIFPDFACHPRVFGHSPRIASKAS